MVVEQDQAKVTETAVTAPVDMAGVHPDDRGAAADVAGRIVDHQGGDVAVSADDRHVIVLDEGVATPRRLFVRPMKRRAAGQVRRWLAFLEKLNEGNSGSYTDEVFRCLDELGEIVATHLVGWEHVYEVGRLAAFDASRLDDVLDDGDVMYAAGQLWAFSTMGAMQKKRFGSPSRVNTPAEAGSNQMQTDTPPSGVMSTRSALDASFAKGDTGAGSGGMSQSDGNPRPSSEPSVEALEPPPPWAKG